MNGHLIRTLPTILDHPEGHCEDGCSEGRHLIMFIADADLPSMILLFIGRDTFFEGKPYFVADIQPMDGAVTKDPSHYAYWLTLRAGNSQDGDNIATVNYLDVDEHGCQTPVLNGVAIHDLLGIAIAEPLMNERFAGVRDHMAAVARSGTNRAARRAAKRHGR